MAYAAAVDLLACALRERQVKPYAKPDAPQAKGTTQARAVGVGSGKNGRGRASHKAQLHAMRKSIKSAARQTAKREIESETP